MAAYEDRLVQDVQEYSTAYLEYSWRRRGSNKSTVKPKIYTKRPIENSKN
jgi:hypothetical protein